MAFQRAILVAPGTLASSRRPARSPRMELQYEHVRPVGTAGPRAPSPGRALRGAPSYGRASTRSTAGRDTRAARRRAAARFRRVSSVSRSARLRISQFQRKHTGWRDGYAGVARRSSQGSLRPHVSHGATSPEHDRQAATAGRDCRDERASSPNAALRVRTAVERAPDCRRQLREVAGEHEPGWPAGVSGRSRVNTGGGESSRCRDSGVRRSCHNSPLSDPGWTSIPPVQNRMTTASTTNTPSAAPSHVLLTCFAFSVST